MKIYWPVRGRIPRKSNLSGGKLVKALPRTSVFGQDAAHELGEYEATSVRINKPRRAGESEEVRRGGMWPAKLAVILCGHESKGL